MKISSINLLATFEVVVADGDESSSHLVFYNNESGKIIGMVEMDEDKKSQIELEIAEYFKAEDMGDTLPMNLSESINQARDRSRSMQTYASESSEAARVKKNEENGDANG
jgi:hypothetical protein